MSKSSYVNLKFPNLCTFYVCIYIYIFIMQIFTTFAFKLYLPNVCLYVPPDSRTCRIRPAARLRSMQCSTKLQHNHEIFQGVSTCFSTWKEISPETHLAIIIVMVVNFSRISLSKDMAL
jgi:hypothetical protein